MFVVSTKGSHNGSPSQCNSLSRGRCASLWAAGENWSILIRILNGEKVQNKMKTSFLNIFNSSESGAVDQAFCRIAKAKMCRKPLQITTRKYLQTLDRRSNPDPRCARSQSDQNLLDGPASRRPGKTSPLRRPYKHFALADVLRDVVGFSELFTRLSCHFFSWPRMPNLSMAGP
ncbi:hypothetical protein K438DRAFT_162894 [Mycena galopus ATCC 62051]|nr:hypothetical protein K438DRAFT_162894 [Mycena galopus ATCC 62051]